VAGINTFLTEMVKAGGMSVSNQYDVDFKFTSTVAGEIKAYAGVTSANGDPIFKMFCDEAQLPNVGTMTGNLTGRYTGQGSVAYAHTPVYTEFQLGWMCDANMSPLKFLTGWHDFIIGNDRKVGGSTLSDMNASDRLLNNRTYAIQYPDSYVCDVRITKLEQGKTEQSRRASISYLMERAFPISIDAVPLAYGNSQLTRVTATFQYARHHVATAPINNRTGTI
jgi:hypothetical protein